MTQTAITKQIVISRESWGARPPLLLFVIWWELLRGRRRRLAFLSAWQNPRGKYAQGSCKRGILQIALGNTPANTTAHCAGIVDRKADSLPAFTASERHVQESEESRQRKRSNADDARRLKKDWEAGRTLPPMMTVSPRLADAQP